MSTFFLVNYRQHVFKYIEVLLGSYISPLRSDVSINWLFYGFFMVIHYVSVNIAKWLVTLDQNL